MNKKIVTFLLGLLFSLTLLELGIRLAKPIFVHNKTASINDSKSYRILCLGNSFTYGIGAPSGESYPDQLQNLFANKTKQKIQVINEGRCIQNSSMLLKTLPYVIKKYHPEIVIMQTGQANIFNQNSYSDYLERINPSPIKNHFKELLNHSSLFRFANYLYASRKNNSNQYLYGKRIHSWDYAKQFSQDYINPEIYQNWDFEKAKSEVEKLESLIKNGKVTDDHFRLLGNLYLYTFKDEKKAAMAYMQGTEWEPTFPLNTNPFFLMQIYKTTTSLELKAEIDHFKDQLQNTNKELATRLSSLDKKDVENWLISDLTEIFHYLQERKILLILQTYPPVVLDHFKTGKEEIEINSHFFINALIRHFAMTHNIPLYDLEKELGALEENAQKDLLLSHYSKIFNHYDGHLNSKGYLLNAKGLFQLINKTEFK